MMITCVSDALSYTHQKLKCLGYKLNICLKIILFFCDSRVKAPYAVENLQEKINK